jgi:threonylcarbamoyladenosine tRNA methylthiotransferase MtaB
MGRLYTTEDYRRAADMLRSAYPGAAITTDIIIGFPGETEDEFEETLSFVREIGFSRIHVFPYSPREGTPAARMRAHVSADVKRERTRRMIELGRELERSYVERMIGQIRSVLFERETDVGAEGYTREYIRTAARGARAGTLRDVCLTDFHGDCASGVLI